MTFPAERFASFADYVAWTGVHETVLQDRRLIEAAPPDLGTCGACLRPSRFAAGACDCPERLAAAERALLHAALAEGGLCGWTRLHLFGVPGALGCRLQTLAGPPDATRADLAVGAGPLAAAALMLARRALGPGGVLLWSTAFDPEARAGRPARPGWDILDQAQAAGFARAEMLRPWSRELGYLGGEVFLLRAIVA